MTARRRSGILPVMTTLARHPAFVRLWLSGLFAETAEWMLQVALPVYVYQATGSAGSTALVMVTGILPMLLVSPVAGVVADRFDRRRVLYVVCLAQAAVSVPLLFGSHQGLIYVVMVAQSALASLFEPTRNALVPALVGADRLASANGLMGFNSSISRLAGSALGGLVLGVWGLSWVIVGYLAALVLAALLLVPRFGVHVESTPAEPGGWLDGVRAFRDPSLRATGVSLGLIALGQGMFLVLFVVFVTGPLHGGDADVGLLRGIQAIGGLGAGLLIAAVANRVSAVRMMGLGILTLGLCSALIWNLPHVTVTFWLYVVLFAAIGAPAVVAQSAALTAVQLRVPDEQTGRVLAAVYAGFAGLTTVGTLVAGFLVGTVGLDVLLDVQAGMLVAAGIAALLRRA
nr:MFS transporter [Kutzneria chonburiensis]